MEDPRELEYRKAQAKAQAENHVRHACAYLLRKTYRKTFSVLNELKANVSPVTLARAFTPKIKARNTAHYYKDGVKHVIATDDGLVAV